MKRLVLLLAACGSSAKPAPVVNTTPPPPPPAAPKADCAAIFDKMLPIMAPEMKVTPEQRQKAIDDCQKEYAKNPDDPMFPCLTAANDKATITACLESADKRERGHGPRRTEADLQLDKIGKNAKVVFIETSEFPKGTTKQLPEKGCCAQPNSHCAVTTDWPKDPVWSVLDFEIDEPNLFQYSYTSDGKTFHAEAVGDLDCDGVFITYKLDGDAPNGNPRVTLTPPPANSD